MPAGGKFGSITLTSTVDDRTVLNLSFEEGILLQTWDCTDAVTGNKFTSVNGTGSPVVYLDWPSEQGGTAKLTLLGTVNGIQCVNQELTSLKMKGAKKWSNLTSLQLYDNQLAEITTSEWPALTSLVVNLNAPLASLKTYEWPNLVVFNVRNTGIDSLETYEWPELTTFNARGCTNMTTCNMSDWAKVQTVDLSYSDSLTHFDGKEWPEVTEILAGYSYWETVNTSNSWSKLVKMDFFANQNCYSFPTHPGWTSLESLSVAAFKFTEMETHPEWVSIKSVSNYSNFSCTGFRFHPEWVNFDYANLRQCNIAAEDFDHMLITANANYTGSTYKTLDYRLNYSTGPDGNRSAEALQALNDLTANGWTIMR